MQQGSKEGHTVGLPRRTEANPCSAGHYVPEPGDTGMGELLPALGGQGCLLEGPTCPMANALELGEAPTPKQE